MSHSFLTFGCEPSAVVDRERPSVCGSVLWGRYLLRVGGTERRSAGVHVCVRVRLCVELLRRQQPSGISPIHPDKLPWRAFNISKVPANQVESGRSFHLQLEGNTRRMMVIFQPKFGRCCSLQPLVLMDHPKKIPPRTFFFGSAPSPPSLLNALHVLSARWMLQIRLTRFRIVSPSAGPVPEPRDHGSPASAEALVLVLEVVQPLGEEHHDHEEEEEHQRGHAHHHAQHLELGDGPVAARALVPDVVLHVAPAHGRWGRGGWRWGSGRG